MVGGTAAPLGSVREMLYGIKLDECPAPLRTMLAKFDKNGNGIIDPDELPIANDDGISIKAFPENVQPILRAIDEEGNGKLDMGELTEIFTAHVELKKANKEGSIAIKTLPKEIQATLKVFDVDNDGTVAPMELARGAELYKDSKKTTKRLTIFSGVLLLILLALVGVIVGLTAVVVEASKETKTDGSGITTVKGSSTIAATAAVVKTRTLYDAFKMPSSQLDGITSLMLTNKGRTYKHTITGFEKMPNKVIFFSARGDTVEATPNAITVKDSSGIPRFQKMSSEESRRRRELLANDGGSSNNNEASMTQTQTQSSDGAACWESSDKTSCSGNAKCLWMPDSYCTLNFDNFFKQVDDSDYEKFDKAFATCEGLKTGEACKTNPDCEFAEYSYCMEQFECSVEEVPDGQGGCKPSISAMAENEEEEKKQEEDPCKSTEYKITDGTCKPLTVCNPNEEYESVAPTKHGDRVCKPLTVCNRYGVQPGYGLEESESVAPTMTSDRECVKKCVKAGYTKAEWGF